MYVCYIAREYSTNLNIQFKVIQLPEQTVIQTVNATELVIDNVHKGIYFADIQNLNVSKAYIILAIEPDGYYAPILLEKTLMV